MGVGGGGRGGFGVSANEHSCAHGAQINFGDLSPYLSYVVIAYGRLFGQLLQYNYRLFGQLVQDKIVCLANYYNTTVVYLANYCITM
jgi:hypothetical protein